jgi:hypothetical protein
MASNKDKLVAQLWDLLVKDLIHRLEHGEEVVDKEGNTHTVKPGSATLAVIARFLKDNDVGVLPGNAENDKLAQLLAKATEDMDDQPFN